ncbi:MAG: hypothetical protein OXH79_13200 [Boseongicola sp.]|nr:hypothetical protein [Boseongicola sp.]
MTPPPCAVHVPVGDDVAVRDRLRTAKVPVHEDEPLAVLATSPLQCPPGPVVCRPKHRAHGLRPDPAILSRTYFVSNKRQQDRVGGLHEVVGNRPVQVVGEVADADGEPDDVHEVARDETTPRGIPEESMRAAGQDD